MRDRDEDALHAAYHRDLTNHDLDGRCGTRYIYDTGWDAAMAHIFGELPVTEMRGPYPEKSPFGAIGRIGSPDAYLIDPGAGSGSDRVTRFWPQPAELADITRRGGSITPLYSQNKSPDQTYQKRVANWLLRCFNSDIADDRLERSDRFIEEALELVQSTGYSRVRAYALVDYVFNREAGDPPQEVGGVMVGLAALCTAHGMDMTTCGEAELTRISDDEIIARVRDKHALKPKGDTLPDAVEHY